MMNPANIMKIMNAKNKFTANHPKFVAFLSAVFSREMEEGTVIEITLTRPGEEPMTTNMKIQQSDLDLMRELQDMAKNQLISMEKTSAHAKIFLRKNTKIYT